MAILLYYLAQFFGMHEVHAFEVNPNSYRALEKNIRANEANLGPGIRAHHCALSDISEQKALLKVEKFTVESVAKNEAQSGRQSLFNIDMWALDDFCEAKTLEPDLMKIDVEGFQAKIVPGAMNILSRVRPIVLLEFDGTASCNNFGVTNKEVIKPLMAIGYRLIWWKHRISKAHFDILQWDDLCEKHEINSLGILVP